MPYYTSFRYTRSLFNINIPNKTITMLSLETIWHSLQGYCKITDSTPYAVRAHLIFVPSPSATVSLFSVSRILFLFDLVYSFIWGFF